MEIQIDQLKVDLAGINILQSIDLHVKSKQFVALLGPNGSGKSTLLKSVYRVLKPSEGEISIDNQSIKSFSSKELAKQLSVVSQFQLFAFDFTVEEVVQTARIPHKKYLQKDTDYDKKIVLNALEKTGLISLKDKKITALSGGEKQRLALARAIAQEADVMILDEPSNHLDIKYQMEVLSTIKSMNVTVLTALHDLSLAAKYCDYIYFIKKGRIVYHGSIDEVLTKEIIQDVYEVDCEVFRHPTTQNICISYY